MHRCFAEHAFAHAPQFAVLVSTFTHAFPHAVVGALHEAGLGTQALSPHVAVSAQQNFAPEHMVWLSPGHFAHCELAVIPCVPAGQHTVAPSARGNPAGYSDGHLPKHTPFTTEPLQHCT
jgi:hypothetical protein